MSESLPLKPALLPAVQPPQRYRCEFTQHPKSLVVGLYPWQNLLVGLALSTFFIYSFAT